MGGVSGYKQVLSLTPPPPKPAGPGMSIFSKASPIIPMTGRSAKHGCKPRLGQRSHGSHQLLRAGRRKGGGASRTRHVRSHQSHTDDVAVALGAQSRLPQAPDLPNGRTQRRKTGGDSVGAAGRWGRRERQRWGKKVSPSSVTCGGEPSDTPLRVWASHAPPVGGDTAPARQSAYKSQSEVVDPDPGSGPLGTGRALPRAGLV